MTATRTICVALATLVAAGTALGATAARDPKTLALRKSDVPPGSVQFPVPDSTVRGPSSSFYSVTFNFRRGSREREVTSYVSVSSKAGDAATQYRIQAGGAGGKGATPVRLPSYGGQEYAAFVQGPKVRGESRAYGIVVVRRKSVVWSLTVESCGPFAPYGCNFGTTPPNLTKAQAVAELETFAPIQKKRVGNG
jgi:hypothetical protein